LQQVAVTLESRIKGGEVGPPHLTGTCWREGDSERRLVSNKRSQDSLPRPSGAH
jgi:hypothetical protein